MRWDGPEVPPATPMAQRIGCQVAQRSEMLWWDLGKRNSVRLRIFLKQQKRLLGVLNLQCGLARLKREIADIRPAPLIALERVQTRTAGRTAGQTSTVVFRQATTAGAAIHSNSARNSRNSRWSMELSALLTSAGVKIPKGIME